MFSPSSRSLRRRRNGAFAAALWAVLLLLAKPSSVKASRLSSVQGALASPFRYSSSSSSNEGGESNSTSVPQQAKRKKDLSSSKEIKFLRQQKMLQMTRGGAVAAASGTTSTRAVQFALGTTTPNARWDGGKQNRTTRDATPTRHTQHEDQKRQTKSANNPHTRKFFRNHESSKQYKSEQQQTRVTRGLSPAAQHQNQHAASTRGGAVAGRNHRRTDRARFAGRSESSINFHSMLLVRGGAAVICEFRVGKSLAKTPMSDENQIATSSSFAARNKRILWTAIFCTICYALFLQRDVWMPLLTDKQALQETTLSLLDQLKPDTDDPADWFRAYLLYGAAMASWELLGLSTIPVETAAGMVFGFGPAAVSSLTGKLCGAFAAYMLGRKTALRGWMVQQRAVQQSTILQLLINSGSSSDTVATSTTSTATNAARPHPPLLTAFLMKFSCFPEAIKNVGSSLIHDIQPWMFLLVTLVHGGAYTLLWTWLGVDTAARLNNAPNDVVPTNHGLRVALVASVISGFVLTPLAMVWWVRDLQRKAAVRQDRSRPFSWRMVLQKILSAMSGGDRQQRAVVNAKRDPSTTKMTQTSPHQRKEQVVAFWPEISPAEIFVIGIVFALLVTTGVVGRNSWSLAGL